MKKELLEKLGLTKEVMDQVLEENQKDLEAEQAKGSVVIAELETAKEERDGLKIQLDDAGKQIEEFKGMDIDGIKQAADEWKVRAEQVQKEAETKIAAKEYEFNAREYIGKFKFTSELAKRAILNDFIAKEFKHDNGKFMGADDYMVEVQESDPGAFASDNPPPRVVLPGTPPAQGKETSKMTYSEICDYLKENPNAAI